MSRAGGQRVWLILMGDALSPVSREDELLSRECDELPELMVQSEDIDGVDPACCGVYFTGHGGDFNRKGLFKSSPKF